MKKQTKNNPMKMLKLLASTIGSSFLMLALTLIMATPIKSFAAVTSLTTSLTNNTYTANAGVDQSITFTTNDQKFDGNRSLSITGYGASTGTVSYTYLNADNKTTSTSSQVLDSSGITTIPKVNFVKGTANTSSTTIKIALTKTINQTKINYSITDASMIGATVTTTITPADASKLVVIQDITAPSANGGSFSTQPKVAICDTYGNIRTGDANVITASNNDSDKWNLTGTTTVTAVGGVATFTNLGTTNNSSVSGAQLKFTSPDLTDAVSSAVTLPVKVLTVTFKNYDGTTLKTESVNYGSGATAPSVPSRIGYTLDGWDKPLSDITADTTITAKWSIITGLTVNVTNTNGTVSGNLESYTFGDTVSLTATANSGYKFVSWADNTGKVLSTNPTYSFVITQTTNLTANFAEETFYRVIFYNNAGQILSTQTVAQGYDAVSPADPTRPNYTFVKWDKPYTNVQSNLSIYPVFTANQITYSLTVIDGESKVTTTYNISTDVTVTAKVPDGKVFAGWKDETDSIISYNQTYSFYLTSSKTLTAIYDVPPVKSVPTISLDKNVIQMNVDNSYGKLYFTSAVNVPAGYQLIECGVVVTKTYVENLTKANALTFVKSTAQNSAGQFYSYFKVLYGTTLYVRSYVTYKDLATGEIITKYSINTETATLTKQ